MPYSQSSAFVFENKEALNYLGICDVGECARTDVCLHVNAGHVFFVGMSCFSSSPSSFLGVCVHMHHVNFFFIIFKGKSLSWVHVCLCAQACVPRIFFRGRCFWRMHVYACSHDMHILYMDVCTLVEQLCCIQLLHTRAHAEQVLRGRLTFPFLISSFFFFFLIFIWFRLLLDLFFP